MGKACLLIKSSKVRTYEKALEHIDSKLGSMEKLEIIFFRTPRLEKIVRSIPQSVDCAVSIRDVSNADSLKQTFKQVDICDVSGLPKEDFAEVLAVAIGHREVALCTLTRNDDQPYPDLMKSDSVKSFNNSYLVQVGFNRAIIAVGICGVVAFGLLKIIEFFPNADTLASWLGIGVGLLGLVSTWYSIRYA